MKKIYFLLIALLCSATMAFAYEAEIDGIYYDFDHENKTATVTNDGGYLWDDNGAGYIQSEIVIPEKVTYNGVEYSVTEIGDFAFSRCSSLTSITIPNSVTTIGGDAFLACYSLVDVYIFDVGAWFDIEFKNCSTANPLHYAENLYLNNKKVTDVVVPEDVDSIKDYVFYNYSALTSITIPNRVTFIGESAFRGCSGLTSIEIPNSVVCIGGRVFRDCAQLRYAKIGSGVKYIGESIFYCYNIYDEESDEWIPMVSSLDTLICEFGDDVELDFYESSDETWHPLNATKNLRYFQGPAKLVNSIKEEFQTQFSNKLTEVHITDGELDENGFNYINRSKKSLHTIDLAGTTNTAINDLAFYDCYKLENLMLPGNLETIGFKAMAECYQLKEINIPASVVEINDAAFENCRSIKSITFGGQAEAKSFASRMKRAAADGDVALQRIGNWAFYNCHALENLVIPEGVTEVGDAAFYGCTYLDSLALPSTTQRIGDNCFALCSRMKQINVNAIEPPTIFAKTFFDVNRNIPVIVPEGAREAYANDEYWGEFINVVESDEDTSIENTENANIAIYSVGGVLYVDGLSADYQLFDVNGRLIYTGRDAQLSLPRGVYVIAVGDEVEKIVL
ncbi:MAG: leucine-rich repeat domain-containing protein [Paludibacteraceae bacterium]|nr:leucine-rich repeat domain-containing protein [Paludibacteraceae bacterium]